MTFGLQAQEEKTVHVLLNIDGLPLHLSSAKQFWLIFCVLSDMISKRPSQ